MKVLWITNLILPPIAEKLRINASVKEGWTYSLAKSLKSENLAIELSIATVYNGKHIVKEKIDNVTYYLIPTKGSHIKYQKELENYWLKIYNELQPDIVHLHGTEYAHGLAFLNACPQAQTVVSLQGMISVIARYYLGGITSKDVIQNITLRDLVRGSLFQERRSFIKRGKNEIQILKKVKHIIGRTSWDKAQSWAINPNTRYHFCNETLRLPFYNKEWQYSTCKPHTIFVSQGNYPVKGLHQLIKSLPYVLSVYPDTKVYVAGHNITDTSSLTKKLKLNGYGKYLINLISKLKLNNVIYFTGTLNEDEMLKYYLSCNLFILPSSIENSPNSLGEAQLLGMPCIASYVGGVPDLMQGFENWLYRYEEIEMLAQLIIKIFSTGKNINFQNQRAFARHNMHTNSMRLYDIYKQITKI